MPRIEKGEHRTNAERGQSGLFRLTEGFEPNALDLDILRILPDDGSMKGRYLQDVMKVVQIKKTLDPTLPSALISTRLRYMWDEGLVLKVTGLQKAAAGWQRSAAGKALAIRGTLAEDDG